MAIANTRHAKELGQSVTAAGDRERRDDPGQSPFGLRRCARPLQLLGLMLVLAGCTTVGPDFATPAASVPQ